MLIKRLQRLRSRGLMVYITKEEEKIHNLKENQKVKIKKVKNG